MGLMREHLAKGWGEGLGPTRHRERAGKGLDAGAGVQGVSDPPVVRQPEEGPGDAGHSPRQGNEGGRVLQREYLAKREGSRASS